MEIAVDGWRPGSADWDAVRHLPSSALPALTKEQTAVAKKLGIPEADYARSILAGERSQGGLLTKAERLGNLLKGKLSAAGVDAAIHRITLRTIQERFDVELQVNERQLPLKIDEVVVDEYFEGSEAAEKQLDLVVDRVVSGITQ